MTTEEKTELLKDVARLAPKEWDAHTRVSELRLHLGGHICDVDYNEITNAFLALALLKWLGKDYDVAPNYKGEWDCGGPYPLCFSDPEPVYAVLLAVRERLKEMEG